MIAKSPLDLLLVTCYLVQLTNMQAEIWEILTAGYYRLPQLTVG